ncbi:hypothetical protein HS5_04180 [Acidianus sp. HS-5]|nr:hypothetical protein HS5_04180 [Acidianus sp. HS-5]
MSSRVTQTWRVSPRVNFAFGNYILFSDVVMLIPETSTRNPVRISSTKENIRHAR